jgi:UPF0755 protein
MRLLKMLAALVIAIAGGSVWWLIQDYQQFVKTPLVTAEQGMDYHLPAGSSLRRVSADFAGAGLWRSPRDPYWFQLLARKGKLAGRIQAGAYHFDAGLTPYQVLQQLAAGRVTHYSVTLVEGWNFRELHAALEQQPKLVAVLEGMEPDQVMTVLGHPDEHPEGRFLAETYQYRAGATDVSLLKRAYRDMQHKLQREWDKRAPKLPYKTPYDALIMASIIEKETSVAAERPLIAGVFVRRLNKGMRLQTDPTVIYGLGEGFNGNLTRKDLRSDTPYNTYTRKGLPPTPIATPGPAAIHAALHPAAGKALYFVATGTGGHKFSANLKEHNQAVREYLKQRAGQ